VAPLTGVSALAVQIGAESPAGRTALPLAPSAYTITVVRSGLTLGSLVKTPAGAGPYLIPLTSAPAAGDVVLVEGYVNGVRQFAGDYTLPPGYTAGSTITVTLRLVTNTPGNIKLSVDFPAFPGTDEITAAELSLYRSLADYQAGTVYEFKRYRKYTEADEYGAGEDLGSRIPLEYDNLPPGNYVVRIEFFRFKYVRVSRLVQTLIVRDGLTTGRWNNGGGALNWGSGNFASSNANLSGISVGGTGVSGFSQGIHTYSVYKSLPKSSNLPPTLALSVSSAVGGQTVTASLNGTAFTPLSNKSGSLSPVKAVNSLVIMVTAPDGVTKQTYTVSYTYYSGEWKVTGASGSETSYVFATVDAALTHSITGITAVYGGALDWPGSPSDPVPARISVSAALTEAVTMEDSGLPPILLMGPDSGAGKIAPPSNRPLTIAGEGRTVILGDRLTLEGNGDGGVNVSSGSFTMNGGTITGTAASGNGGGVNVSSGSFTMNGGTITGSTAANGGGVYISNGSFTMNGGTISENTATYSDGGGGGGVYVSGGSFTMDGGTITGNIAVGKGGGVYVGSGGSFTMDGGTISGNTAKGEGGGGMWVEDGSFTMKGGTISGNTANAGGGVLVNSGSFTMNGGTISGNTAKGEGGGVRSRVTFTLNGGSISGNTAGNNGGGIRVEAGSLTIPAGSTVSISGNMVRGSSGNLMGGGVHGAWGSITMRGGVISGNSVVNEGTGSGMGGGVSRDFPSSFNMSGGSILGNSADYGGGLAVSGNLSSTMSGGTINGNHARIDGGGVYVIGNKNVDALLNMSGGVINGNTAGGNGGGVYIKYADGSSGFYSSVLEMNGGVIGGNTADGKGGGVCVGDGNTSFYTGAGALVNPDNDVYLEAGKTITIQSTLTGAPPVARITPDSYSKERQVLEGGYYRPDSALIAANYDKFTVTPEGGVINWAINDTGYLQQP
jgi:hypothetical protein